MLREPLIHTGITDVLPDDHPLAWKHVYCDCGHGPVRGELLHASNNENMQPWVETGAGNFTLKCFADFAEASEPEDYALPEGGDGA